MEFIEGLTRDVQAALTAEWHTFTTQQGLVSFTVGYLLFRRFIYPKIIFPVIKGVFMWLFVRSRNEIEILLHHQKKAALATIAEAEQTVIEVDRQLEGQRHI